MADMLIVRTMESGVLETSPGDFLRQPLVAAVNNQNQNHRNHRLAVRRQAGLFCAFAFFACAAFATGDDDTLVLLEGDSVAAVVSGIDDGGVVTGDRVPDGLDLDAMRRIVRAGPSSAADAPIVVELVEGRIHANGVSINDDFVEIASPLSPSLKVSIDLVRAIRFEPKRNLETFEEALADPLPQSDQLFVKDGDRVQKVAGLVEELSATEVVFSRGGNRLTLPTAKAFGIVLAPVGVADFGRAKARVQLSDGSVIPGTIASLQDAVLTVKLTPANQVQLPWESVARIDVRSSRVAFLSDLNPTEAFHEPVVTLSHPWQRDRSASGGPLTLKYDAGKRSREFDKGLGTHSRTRLTFAAEGKYQFFAATLGIDAVTDGRGDCLFIVLGDGKELFNQAINAKDEPQSIRVDISGVDELTLIVEPGADLDLADHADWCDARLIKADQ